MIRVLKKSYGIHLWYEQTLSGDEDRGDGEAIVGKLVPGPMNLEISMADKGLSYEEDRPTVMFLERQSGLLG